jgi:hypothetical protein
MIMGSRFGRFPLIRLMAGMIKRLAVSEIRYWNERSKFVFKVDKAENNQIELGESD